MDEVFRAINDSSRRLLLDALFERDGRSLAELCEVLPGMTRYGVMNHLGVLEEAGLIATVRRGRSKHHYLNPVPIRLIHDRWISKYSELRVGALSDLKSRLERGEDMDKPVHVYKAYINAGVEAVWDAIVDPDRTVQYFYGTRVKSEWKVGSTMNYHGPDGQLVSEGNILAIDPPNRIEFTFHALWSEQIAAEDPVREVWSIRDVNGMAELTIELYDIEVGGVTYDEFTAGIPYIVSGLKSLLETGQALPSQY